MLESVVAVIVVTVDTAMISVLGKGAVSAVSLTTQPKLIIFALFYALGTTTSVFVAQALGKNDQKEANAVFHIILRVTVLLSVILGIAAGALAKPIMHLCSRQADTIDMSVTFFRIIMIFMIFQNVSVVLNAALRGIGKTRVTLISGIVLGVVDFAVNYLLIEGHLGFPRMEIAGDAIGTVSGSVAACVVSLIYLIRSPGFLNLKGILTDREKDADRSKRIREKATGVISENILTRVGFLLSSIIVSTLHSSETAVYFTAMILLNYSFAFGDGLQAAAVTLVGRSVGAGEKNAVQDYARKCLIVGAVVAGVLSVIYIAGAGKFFSIFYSDQASISLGMKFSYIASALTFLQIIRIVETGIMRGIGEVKVPMILATISVLCINPATSFILVVVLSIGIWGIWGASLVSQTVWVILAFIKEHQIRSAFIRGSDRA